MARLPVFTAAILIAVALTGCSSPKYTFLKNVAISDGVRVKHAYPEDDWSRLLYYCPDCAKSPNVVMYDASWDGCLNYPVSYRMKKYGWEVPVRDDGNPKEPQEMNFYAK